MKWFLSITARLLSGDGEQEGFLLPDCATHLLIIKEAEQILDLWFLELLFHQVHFAKKKKMEKNQENQSWSALINKKKDFKKFKVGRWGE